MDKIAEFVYQTGFEDIPDETVAYTRTLASKIVAATLVGAKTVAGWRAASYALTKGQRLNTSHFHYRDW
jgi:hypothetical protein